MNNLSSFVIHNIETKQKPEGEGWDDEQINGSNTAGTIA